MVRRPRVAELLVLTGCLFAAAVEKEVNGDEPTQEKAPPAAKTLADGVYLVLRDGSKEKDVLPIKDGETLLVDRHRYLGKSNSEPPRYLVVRSARAVELNLAEGPKTAKEDEGKLRILLKLRPKAAAALESVTREHLNRQLTIVLGGDVVTTHRIRTVIQGGDVQISSCDAGAAEYLLEQLQARHKKE